MNKIIFKTRKCWIVFTFGFLFTSCVESNVKTYPDVNSLLCKPRPIPPILTNSEAICFAAYIDKVKNLLLNAQHSAGYEGWKVIPHREEMGRSWKVQVRSTGKIFPSYRCTLSFTEKGESISPNIPIVQCGYKK
ncbi:MAG: hypothetical protein GQ532_20390 [Methylomarinum sp.]|nr:hypothetical protein [Methylomarinum sp.]